MAQALSVKPGTRIQLKDFEPGYTGGMNKESAEAEAARHTEAIDKLAYRLYAEDRRAVLVVLQGMDASGKDGTIRYVFRAVDPQSCQLASFKQPSGEELEHDFLWRIHREVPRRGCLGIFNRSHYEDVVVVRVHGLVPKAQWQQRFEQINEFEKMLTENGTTIIKCFLHISSKEQRERLQARLDNPSKRWKFRLGDLEERKLWNDYQQAYEDALTECNTKHAPWHIIPADRKWYRNFVVSRLVHEKLDEMNPQFPAPDPALEGVQFE